MNPNTPDIEVTLKRVFVAFCFSFFALVGIPKLAFAVEADCEVNPFIVNLKQGESTSTDLILKLEKSRYSVEAKVGNLPNDVRGGFSKEGGIVSGESMKTMKLLLQAGPSAQIGSFMVPVEYSIAGSKSNVCQFNLKVTKGEARTAGSIAELVSSTASDVGFFDRIWNWLARLFVKSDEK
jgi:hypothetical protein